MQGLSFKTVIIITLLMTFVSLAVCPRLSATGAANEREVYHQAISGLRADAEVLAQELVALDLKHKKALGKKEIIEKEIMKTREMKDEALEQYNRSLDAKNQSLKKVRPWINFQYRLGYWSLVDAIIGSESMAELVNRSVMVSLILSRQVKSYRDAEEACSESLRREKSLTEALDLLDRQNKSLEEQINQIKYLSDRRLQYYEEIKRSSEELAQKVSDLERKYLQTLNLFDFMTGAMAKFPWQNVEPDRISMGIGGISLEFSESKLNMSLQQSGDEILRDLSVRLFPGMFSLTGKDKNSPSTFTLGGTLVPTGQSSNVQLEPKSLSIDGIPVAGQVLGELAGGKGFNLPLPDAMSYYKVSNIDIQEQKVILTLSF